MRKKFCMLFILMLTSSFVFEGISAHACSISEEGFIVLYDGYHSIYGASIFDSFNSRLPDQFIIEYTFEPLTETRLSSCDILGISHPIETYSSEEIYCIKKFVERGGGLLIMGTGWAYVDYLKKSINEYPLNQIVQEFEVTMNDDLIVDPTNFHTLDGADYPLFTVFAEHPATEGLTQVYAGWPSSFSITGDAIPIVMGDEDSYSANYHHPVYKTGDFPPVAVALEYKKGRAVFLGNDGFLGVCLDDYDNLKFGLNILYWLTKKEKSEQAADYFETAEAYFQNENFEMASENYDLASRLYQDLEAYDKLSEISMKKEITRFCLLAQSDFNSAMSFLEDEKIDLAADHLENARNYYNEALNRAINSGFENKIKTIESEIEEIDYYIDICGEIGRADNMVDTAKTLLEQEDYEHSLEQMEQALQIYEEYEFTNRKNEANNVIIQILKAKNEALTSAKNEALTRVNTNIIKIAFAITLVIVSLLYFGRKGYKGENRRKNTISYLATIITLLSILVISISALSLQLGNATYLLTFSMCLFFLMILNAYIGR